MDPAIGKGIGDKNELGTEQISVVETIDYRSSAGQGQERRDVQITHQIHPKGDDSMSSGGVLAGAAASVAATLQSAKDVIAGK